MSIHRTNSSYPMSKTFSLILTTLVSSDQRFYDIILFLPIDTSTYLHDNKGTLGKQGESLSKERCRHLLINGLHQRDHPSFDIGFPLRSFLLRFKKLMGKIDGCQHREFRWGRRFHPFGQVFHMIVDKVGQPSDIGIIAITRDCVPLTIYFDINGLSQWPPPWAPRHIQATRSHS